MIKEVLHGFAGICREYPQIAVFLSVAVGYYVGKKKIFGFSLGSTAGVLLAALLIGQMNIPIPSLLKAVAFALFIFCIGYKIGPQFFGALKKEGLKYVWLSFFVAIVGLVVAVALSKFFGFDKGTAAGLLGGALTQSSVIGTADGAIKHLSSSEAQKAILDSNVAIAYAITYVFGTAGLIVFYKMVPRIMKIDLKAEARKLEEEMSGGSSSDNMSIELFSWYKQLDLRAYRVENPDLSGKTVKEIESSFPEKTAVDGMKRDGQIMNSEADTVVMTGDILTLVGWRRNFLKADKMIGPEVGDKDMTEMLGEILDICVLKSDVAGKTLEEISRMYGHGCFLKRVTRQGHELPVTRSTVINKCDVLSVTGAQKDVEKLVRGIGYPERFTVMTDLVTLGAGCMLGILLGLIMVPVAGIPITLGVGGGVLVSGLVFGWLRAVHPTFGQIPSGAQWVFTDLGLNLFIACVGLTAGPRAVSAFQSTGLSLFAAGVILTLVPHITGLIFGRSVLKLNPVLLLGAMTGAGTITAALNALKEEAGSSAPALGYTVPYAFGNVILTVWGTVIINLT